LSPSFARNALVSAKQPERTLPPPSRPGHREASPWENHRSFRRVRLSLSPSFSTLRQLPRLSRFRGALPSSLASRLAGKPPADAPLMDLLRITPADAFLVRSVSSPAASVSFSPFHSLGRKDRSHTAPVALAEPASSRHRLIRRHAAPTQASPSGRLPGTNANGDLATALARYPRTPPPPLPRTLSPASPPLVVLYLKSGKGALGGVSAGYLRSPGQRTPSVALSRSGGQCLPGSGKPTATPYGKFN